MVKFKSELIIICVVALKCIGVTERTIAEAKIPEDGRLNFTELALKYGQHAEEYNVITKDGYILKLNHISGDRSRPVMLIHGALDTGDSYILRGNTSLAISLAAAGYDVWATNFRGNRYSRRHRTLKPDKDEAFWDFTVHEYGCYDLPAFIDFVLDATGQDELSAIGFSEGTASMYVLASSKPEYNGKIKVFISLAPICYLHNMKPYLSTLLQWNTDINRGLLMSRTEEFAGFNSVFKKIWDILCMEKAIGYTLCLVEGLFQFTGIDTEEVDEDFFSIVVGHFPAGTSRKNLYHLSQIGVRRVFARYDYGEKENQFVYNSKTPPVYDLSKVTMKVALFVAKNDRMSTIKDVELLREELPNVVAYKTMSPASFNHVDYIWGRNTHRTMFPHIFELLNRYK